MMHQLVVHESIGEIAHVVRNKVMCMSYCSSKLQEIITSLMDRNCEIYLKKDLVLIFNQILDLCKQCEFYRMNISSVFENYVTENYLTDQIKKE